MKAIIDNKLYDTEKAECLGAFSFGDKLYRTAKGILYVVVGYSDELIVDQQKVKVFVGKYAPDIYVKIYGEVEEA